MTHAGRHPTAAPPPEGADELYDGAPCGYLTTRADGTIVRANRTLAGWLGLAVAEVVGRSLGSILTVGARMYHETHVAPLLQLQGAVQDIAVDLRAADGAAVPVLLAARVVHDDDGVELGLRITLLSAAGRRAYERELLEARHRAEEAERRADRLYEVERDVARVLQRSLLAGDPPDDDRCGVASLYRPGVDSLEVGGDWHDAFCIGADRIAVAVGDVVGHGIHAAASMGQLRSAVRALAAADLGPGSLLVRLDRFVHQVGAGRMATLACGELDLRSGLLRYACAGHPPPLLVPVDGEPRYLWEGRSMPLATTEAAVVRTEAEVQLAPGDRVVLYTDGLIERRRRSFDDGLEVLALHSALTRRSPLPAFVEGLGSALHSDAVDRDDVCILVLEHRGPTAPG